MADLSMYPKDAMQAAVNELRKHGIVGLELQSAILSVIGKESAFVPKPEISYANTSVARIRAVFGSHFTSVTDDQLESIKKNPVQFFEYVYGGKYGNTSPGDGYKYRGRGLNEITFKDIYRSIGNMIGVDLVTYPDKLDEPLIAAAAAAAFFVMAFQQGKASGQLKAKIGVNDVSEITDTTTAVKAAIQANAGWKTDFNNSVVQEGYKKALATVEAFKDGIVNAFSSASQIISQNKGSAAGVLFFLALLH